MTKSMMKMLLCVVMTGFVLGIYTVDAAERTSPLVIKPPLIIPPISSVTLNYDNNFKSAYEGVIIEAAFYLANIWPSQKLIGLINPSANIHLFVSPQSSNPMSDGNYQVIVNITNTPNPGTFQFSNPLVMWSAFAGPGAVISTCATPSIPGPNIGGCGAKIPLNSKKQIDIVIKHTTLPWINSITIQRFK